MSTERLGERTGSAGLLEAGEQSNARTLSDADLEALSSLLAVRVAEQVVELLTNGAAREKPPALADAAEVARRFGVSRDWAYRHADELGAIRLGEGSRGRLRFDLERVAEALTSRSSGQRSEPPAEPGGKRDRGRRRRRRSGTGPDLLPIRGENPCP